MHQRRPPSGRCALSVGVEREAGVLRHVVELVVVLREAVVLVGAFRAAFGELVAELVLRFVEVLISLPDAARSAGAPLRYRARAASRWRG